jgi:adenine-specific DNA-methyltransferase
MNKTDLIQKVKALEGLTQDERSYLINLVNTKKKYGLVWEDKPEEVEEQLRENLPVLQEVKDKAIINGEEHPNHILIEGDNLHALTALTFTHEGKIDVIYIDPPYNTGNKDFRYNDTFKDEYIDRENPFRHSTWLSFMSRRLKIAKRLLKDSGVIFISIDDNEIAQLKILCDDILNENNFIEIFSWVRTETPARLSKKSLKVVEYVLAYQKSNLTPSFKGFKSESTSSNTLLNKPNAYKTLIFPENIVDTGLNNGFYKKGEYGTSSYKIVLEEDTEVKDGYFVKPIVLSANFRWGQEKLEDEIANGTKVSIRTKTFSPSYEKSEYEAGAPKNLINREVNVFTNESAKRELDDLGFKNFDYPKPVSLIRYLTSFVPQKDNLILDFFAGSGTTLHATMALNAEDGGNRQCILVTNNENNICEEVTYERNKRVMQGYTNAKGEKVEGLSENNLRYYKSEFVSREPSLKNKRQLTQLATELLCIKEDCYTEQKINIKQARLFANNKVTLLILFDDHVIPQAVEFIKRLEAPEIKVYVFSMGSDPYTEDFGEVLDKVTLCALPDAIYKAYQNVLPKKNRVVPIIEDEVETPTNESGEQLSIL